MADIEIQRTRRSFFVGVVLALFCVLFGGCSDQQEPQVGTDVEFVQEQFPQIKDIEEVKYYYHVKSNEREIGLQNIEFCGIIKIGEDFSQKIQKEYEWKATKKSEKVVPKSVLDIDETYHFLFSEGFSNDGKYVTHSWGGDFYLDPEEGILYFDCEW